MPDKKTDDLELEEFERAIEDNMTKAYDLWQQTISEKITSLRRAGVPVDEEALWTEFGPRILRDAMKLDIQGVMNQLVADGQFEKRWNLELQTYEYRRVR